MFSFKIIFFIIINYPSYFNSFFYFLIYRYFTNSLMSVFKQVRK
jgi:hypothetical protein